ncbi:hypothetical protein AB0436_04985 [Streptomyces sp. NPDC051322]|uniref:hypothetical protein n=1 Tax=Streptomyces sp. NPDC051322 TaxID=3154645 RepID=UPI00344C32DD
MAEGSHEVTLRIQAPATFRMYNADEGADAANSDFVVPVAVKPGAGGPARNVKVVVDTSGLEGVARAGKGGYGPRLGASNTASGSIRWWHRKQPPGRAASCHD